MLNFMSKDWFKRLTDAIAETGEARRSISLRAGLAESYVQQMIQFGKQPSVDKFIALCEAIGRDPVEILTGARQDGDALQVLRLFSAMTPQQQQAFLDYLKTVSPETPADDAAPGHRRNG